MIKLVVDCTCEMSVAEAASKGIVALPMRICFGEQEYLAGENLDNATFYRLLAESKELPKTMAVNPEDYCQAIQPLLDAGHEVFVMALSSGLSSTFNNLCLAAQQLNSPKVHIFDTQTFTIAYYALVMQAKKLIDEGATMPELEQRLAELCGKVRIYTIIDNMHYLVKGGRISFLKGLLSKALNIKPIIGVVAKKLSMVAKGIGYHNAKKQMQRLVQDIDRNLPIYYGHANAAEKAEDFKQAFDFDWAEKREIGPIIGAHGGPGCVGLSFFVK